MTMLEKYDGAVSFYLANLRAKNLQPQTIRNYESYLGRFRGYLAECPCDDAELDFSHVVGWRDKMVKEGTEASTIVQYLSCAKHFFDVAGKRSFPKQYRYIENPVDEEFYPKIVKRPYDTILPDEKVAMLWRNECPDPHFKRFWARNYAMMMLCMSEKIRNAELLDLRLSDVDFDEQYIRINYGKGRKYREVDLSPITASALKIYLSSNIRPAGLSDDDYLFGTEAAHELGARGNSEEWHRGTGQWLSSVIERTVRAITGVADVRSHDLRHIGSRIGLNSGEETKEMLQAELGHSSVVVTEVYAGRLQARRGRESAKMVVAERDKWASENARIAAKQLSFV